MTRPNILFLLVDCLRADAISGPRRKAQTPTLDRLVQTGVTCTQTIASASSTTPCVASLLTGTYSFVHGIRSIFGLKLNPQISSLVETLRQHGYHTYAEMSGPLFPETNLDKGFDSYHFREGSAYLSTAWGADLRYRLRASSFQSPWFMFVHLWELHHHRHILPQFRSRAYGQNRYERALSSLDSELATLLAVLPPDTLVIVHGDHGERVVTTDLRYRFYRLWRDLLRRSTIKREGHEMDVSEELIRVPLVFSFPNGQGPMSFPVGKKVSQLVRQIDVLPTILDLAGASIPANIHGRSLVPALLHDTPLSLEAYLEAFLRVRSDPRNRLVGWRTAEWKYSYAPQNPAIPERLYHLTDDPQERRNCIASHPNIAVGLRHRIEEIQQGTIAPSPGQAMSEAEQAMVAKRLTELGYM